MASEEPKKKLAELRRILREMERVIVAYCGRVDSTLVLEFKLRIA